MSSRNATRIRALTVLGVVLLLLGGLAVGFYWVYDRGLKREGLFDRAQRAYREGRHGDALALARETLLSEPKHDAARRLILESLIASERFDEAKAEGRRYLEEDPERDYAAIRLCQLALREADGEEAERLALTFADRDPSYAYRVLAVVRDHRGLVRNDWRLRLTAAATMRSLASLTENDGIRAEAILFAAEVSHEVAPTLPQTDMLEQRIQADLKEAIAAVNAASQANKSYPYEIAMGRLRVLSDDPEEAALGAKMLRAHATGALKEDVAVTALAKYHIARGEWKEALDLVRHISDTYLWHRLYWMVRRSDQPEQALPLVDEGPLQGTVEGAMLRAELLVRSTDPARKEEAMRSLRAMAEDPASPPGVVLRALILLAAGGGPEEALASADRARLEERRDPQLLALLATLLGAEGSERGLELAERLAGETDELSQSRDLMRLLGGGQAFDRYVDAQVSKGGQAELEHRLHRSLTLLARAATLKGDLAGGQELRSRVRADLEALRASDAATKPELVAGFQFAASLGEAELAGVLLGRAFALPGAPHLLDARVLGFARELRSPETVARLAAGLRAAAANSPARAFLEVFADAVTMPDSDDASSFVVRLEEAAKEPGSSLLALELASRIAFGEGDLANAERLGRAALTHDAESPAALEILGATLLRRGAADDVLALHGALAPDARPEACYRQMARAFLDQGRKDDALATAREALRRFPDSAAAHLLVAQIYRDLGDPRKALSILNLAPPHPLAMHMRAELLRQIGDYPMAERLYQLLLSATHFGDLAAWQGLMETLTQLKRTKEFVVLCGRALDSDYLREQTKTAAMVRYMRGICLEMDGKVGEALADYEEAIRLDGANWGALNNAAWHIARTAVARIAEARAYVDRAMKLKPEDPAVLDTAAEVYSVQQDVEGSLRLIDRALVLASPAKVPSYTVHKAEVLFRGEREDEAKTLAEGVRAKYGDDPAAQRARSLLWEIERQNMPEEEPERLPVLPEDQEESPGTGGGE
jgi:tetratricopeptide (TPR) repeat protein